MQPGRVRVLPGPVAGPGHRLRDAPGDDDAAGQVTFIPLYVTFAKLGWIGTYLPLLIPTFLGNPFFIFLLRQFFRSIPDELSDAARIDGASELRILWRIIVPLSWPALITVGLFTFIDKWGDFFGPLIYLRNPSSIRCRSRSRASSRATRRSGRCRWRPPPSSPCRSS